MSVLVILSLQLARMLNSTKEIYLCQYKIQPKEYKNIDIWKLIYWHPRMECNPTEFIKEKNTFTSVQVEGEFLG